MVEVVYVWLGMFVTGTGFVVDPLGLEEPEAAWESAADLPAPLPAEASSTTTSSETTPTPGPRRRGLGFEGDIYNGF